MKRALAEMRYENERRPNCVDFDSATLPLPLRSRISMHKYCALIPLTVDD